MNTYAIEVKKNVKIENVLKSAGVTSEARECENARTFEVEMTAAQAKIITADARTVYVSEI